LGDVNTNVDSVLNTNKTCVGCTWFL